MFLISLTGLANSGKSTISNYLINNYNFIELSFAEPLKQIVKILFNFNNEEEKYLYDNNYKQIIIPRIGYSGRELLQKIGTELFRNKFNDVLPFKNEPEICQETRNVSKNIWINILNNKIQNILNNNTYDGIIVSDCRFDDEYEFLKSYNFTTYKIIKPDIVKINNHISENGCKYDIIINNDGSLIDLYNKINELVKNMFLIIEGSEKKLFLFNNHHC